MKPYEILPSVISFLLLVVCAIILDAILHFFGVGYVGRDLGLPGVIVIIISFIYSVRKRGYIKAGRLKHYLEFHEITAWLGALALLVHAGVHMNALIPWLAIGAMLASVASGFTGKHLLVRSKRQLEERKQELIAKGLSEEEIDKKLLWDALSVRVMSKWRAVHHPITIVFTALAAFHIFIIFMYGGKL